MLTATCNVSLLFPSLQHPTTSFFSDLEGAAAPGPAEDKMNECLTSEGFGIASFFSSRATQSKRGRDVRSSAHGRFCFRRPLRIWVLTNVARRSVSSNNTCDLVTRYLSVRLGFAECWETFVVRVLGPTSFWP